MVSKHFWIFSHFINGIPVFERHFMWESRAKEKVEELKELYGRKDAFYTDTLPEKYYY